MAEQGWSGVAEQTRTHAHTRTHGTHGAHGTHGTHGTPRTTRTTRHARRHASPGASANNCDDNCEDNYCDDSLGLVSIKSKNDNCRARTPRARDHARTHATTRQGVVSTHPAHPPPPTRASSRCPAAEEIVASVWIVVALGVEEHLVRRGREVAVALVEQVAPAVELGVAVAMACDGVGEECAQKCAA